VKSKGIPQPLLLFVFLGFRIDLLLKYSDIGRSRPTASG